MLTLPAPSAPEQIDVGPLSLAGNWSTLQRSLTQAGFEPGEPHHLAAWARRVDAGVIRLAMCPECGDSLVYHPFHRGSAYRATGVCHTCWFAEEF